MSPPSGRFVSEAVWLIQTGGRSLAPTQGGLMTTTSLLPDVGIELREEYTPEEIERYVESWSQPGAAAGMINYYRASVRQSQKEAAAKLRPLSAPTLVIWGERDSYLGEDLAEPHHDDVPNLDRVERLPDASHWVHHDEADLVNELLIDFFAPAA